MALPVNTTALRQMQMAASGPKPLSNTQKAGKWQTEMYAQQRAEFEPWKQAGLSALAGLQDGSFANNLTQDPGYQARLAEGNKSINAAAAARGMGNSGATLKALTRFGQDYASNEYASAYDRAYSRLSGLAGIGNQASGNMANAAANYGQQRADLYTGMANASAAKGVARDNNNAQMAGTIITAATMFSDERLKTDIQRASKEDLREMIPHLKAYAFKYKSDKYGKGDWIGVMAQDLEKSKLGRTLVVENERGEKTIDQNKVLSMFLATLAEA